MYDPAAATLTLLDGVSREAILRILRASDVLVKHVTADKNAKLPQDCSEFFAQPKGEDLFSELETVDLSAADASAAGRNRTVTA